MGKTVEEDYGTGKRLHNLTLARKLKDFEHSPYQGLTDFEEVRDIPGLTLWQRVKRFFRNA